MYSWIPRSLCGSLIVSLMILQECSGFTQLASTARGRCSPSRIGAARTTRDGKPTTVTSGLISQLAVVALKLRLREQTGVKCEVTATSSDLLLKGQVGPVTVKGRGWRSQLGLTCRQIEATVETCELDMNKIVSKQKLLLTTPANGKAMISLDAHDFGNFITHPLLKPPALDSTQRGVTFLKEDVSVDPKTGAVTFYGMYNGEKWQLALRRSDNKDKRASVSVSPAVATQDVHHAGQELTTLISDFFNEMVFELDGTFLNFKDMMVTAKGDAPSLLLALSIVVRKFPSPGLSF